MQFRVTFSSTDKEFEPTVFECASAFEAHAYIASHEALQFEDDIDAIRIAADVLSTGYKELYGDEAGGDKLVITFLEVGE